MPPPRPKFEHAGKTCYKMAELSTSNPRNLMLVLEAFQRLCVPIDCGPDHMVVSGTSIDMISYIYFKICPMRSVDAPSSASQQSSQSQKRRRRDSDEEEEEEEEDELDSDGDVVAAAPPPPPAAQDVAEDGLDVFRDDSNDSMQPDAAAAAPTSTNDFYRLYDEKPCRVQVDMSSLNAMLRASKRAVVLSIVVFSFSPTGDAERILVKSWDRKSTTSAIVLLQDVTQESLALRPIETTYAVTMPAAEFANWIKEITSASQSDHVSMHMTPADEAARQCLTLTAVGDNGEISKVSARLRARLPSGGGVLRRLPRRSCRRMRRVAFCFPTMTRRVVAMSTTSAATHQSPWSRSAQCRQCRATFAST